MAQQRNEFEIEVEGKTAEEAVKKALKQLKLPRKSVKIQILSEEQKGLFGMPGAKLAKVRVTKLR
ncbi:MAG: Jag N-terminal domain-containing protein [Candidatus Omnitrophica bacterium]|nr:Jag N-terminal domain-containing protein [Candidatus Omnitrophota bacterium]MDD5236369.1 Jag N-terminal domain-containing protein [Candidatus Omnitrophota bacterium]MDD5610696.1 Jag N-terminal domain-containing protein [Candidatus Omnitrophota bacterium]